MLVRMTTHIGGYRNFEEWPEVGGTIELPDAEALDLIAAGHAEEVSDAQLKAERHAQAAAHSDSETASADGDAGAVGDGSGDGTEGHPAEVVDGEPTKPVAKRTGRAKKAAKKTTARKRR